MHLLEAATKILKESNRPLSAEEITEIALQKKMITPKGKTPSRSISAQIYTDLKLNGKDSVFEKVGRNKFTAKKQRKTFRTDSFKSAAYSILKQEGRPLSAQDITRIALRQGLIKTSGKTPDRTMGAQIYTDIQKNKQNSAFIQMGKNTFGLKEWGMNVIKKEIETEEQAKIKEIRQTTKRSIVGDPINYKGLIYGPLNENGVIFLFSKLQDKLGIKIESIQAAFPDAKGRRKTAKGWEDVWIEFEYKSSNFKLHKHDPKECDMIICWEDDWKDCPLEVVELKSLLEDMAQE